MFGFVLKPLKKRFGVDRHYYRLLDAIFGIYPNNIELYKLALVHRSASLFMDDGTPINNERLEFLGDAVLEAIVSDYLFIEFPGCDEGFLTQMRSKIVSRSSLNQLCVDIGLAEHIVSQASGGNYVQKHIYGDALEAMIGAIYLDKGYDYVNRLVINDLIGRYISLDDVTATETDFKSRLIEWCQKNHHTIHFQTGYDPRSTSQSPLFRSVALIDNMETGYGFGASKKEAEQRAAFSVSQVVTDNVGDSLLRMVDNLSRKSGKMTSREKTSGEGGSETSGNVSPVGRGAVVEQEGKVVPASKKVVDHE